MESKIIEIFNKIVYNVLSALYQPFWAAVLLAFLTMFLYLYGKEHGWKKNNFIRNMFATWWRIFKNSSTFRRIFLLAFYTAMILLRTIYHSYLTLLRKFCLPEEVRLCRLAVNILLSEYLCLLY